MRSTQGRKLDSETDVRGKTDLAAEAIGTEFGKDTTIPICRVLKQVPKTTDVEVEEEEVAQLEVRGHGVLTIDQEVCMYACMLGARGCFDTPNRYI